MYSTTLHGVARHIGAPSWSSCRFGGRIRPRRPGFPPGPVP
jgi:hypothetical protein